MQVLELVQRLDAQGLVHGDISPNNIGWHRSAAGQIVVVLFDLSTLRPASQVRSSPHLAPGCSAPWQSLGLLTER